MAKSVPTPSNVHIASLEQRERVSNYDLMRPGSGTPWEDRGSRGVVGSFFTTCARSLTRPRLLLDHIRRPDATGDASTFAIGCGILWAISIAVHNALWLMYYRSSANYRVVDETMYFVASVLQVLAAAPVLLVLLKVTTRLYGSLIATEVRGASPSLIFNLFAYSLGPSILAPIPVIGPVLAALWIFVDLVVAGRKRLYMNWRSAIINAFIVAFVAAAILAAAYFVIRFSWGRVFDPSVQPKAAPTGLPGRPLPR